MLNTYITLPLQKVINHISNVVCIIPFSTGKQKKKTNTSKANHILITQLIQK